MTVKQGNLSIKRGLLESGDFFAKVNSSSDEYDMITASRRIIYRLKFVFAEKAFQLFTP